MSTINALLPIIYFIGLAGLFIGGRAYNRSRSKSETAEPTSYFPPHTTKTHYTELSEMFSPETETGLKLLTTALMKRAMSDVQRAWKIRDEKPPLQGLVKQGIVGDDLWENLTTAEQELDAEIQDVMAEAELYKEGWGKAIFQEASQIASMQKQREEQMQAQQAMAEQQALEAAMQPADE
ncbi:translocation protein S66 [Rhizophlyctis rosea]|uniref:Translocation protein S66 n=1 Tax=Rhizophlyctis rosea TaxID=64517 RepID=A0AAD5SL08_9FUNG|nr:translocation protein S66 [Rhizophlyctis rosea]